MRLKEKSSWKGIQIENANKVGACKCYFFENRPPCKSSRLKESSLLLNDFEESVCNRIFEETPSSSRRKFKWFKEKAHGKVRKLKQLTIIGACKCRFLFENRPL